ISVKLPDARGQLESTLYPYAPRDSISRVNPVLPVALRTGDWQRVIELLDGSPAPQEQTNLVFLSGALADFASGMRAVEAGDVAKAAASSLRLDASLWHMCQQAKAGARPRENDAVRQGSGAPTMQLMPDALLQPLVSSLSVMSLELRGGIFIAKKQIID